MAGRFEVRKVASISRINQNAIWLTLEGYIDARPGQFVMVWLPGQGEKPFSIAAMVPFGLLVVDVGPLSHALHQLQAGDSLWIKGPLGQGFSLGGDRSLLVGGGYGSAPLLSLALAARGMNMSVEVCLGAQRQSGLLLESAFADAGCQVHCTTEDGSYGTQGLVTVAVEKVILASDVDMVYACGPVGMLSALAKLCQTYRLDYQLSWEAHMRCGMGLCGSCEVPQEFDPALPVGWLACYDGPVYAHHWE